MRLRVSDSECAQTLATCSERREVRGKGQTQAHRLRHPPKGELEYEFEWAL